MTKSLIIQVGTYTHIIAYLVETKKNLCLKLVVCIAGMWAWQGGAGAGAGAAGGAEGAHAPHELSDMLQILDQSGTATFEDLNINMFNSNFE